MEPTMHIGRLHVITDTTVQSRYSHAQLAELAIRGGADTIQYRSKESDFLELMKQAGAVAEVCRSANILFLVNDRVDLCLAINADGVHLGLRDMPVGIARGILGNTKVIGGTIRNANHLALAEREGADYVGLGPVFATSSKQLAIPPVGLETVRHVARVATIPVIGIAGITAKNARSVVEAGAWGVAVIGAVCAAEDVAAAAQKLHCAIA
ncbi:MAG: thiamine phosphate synthase [Armatimonadetes bacterium]|nr:thiamine phosphate synthase [Armatimonadota bacterium]